MSSALTPRCQTVLCTGSTNADLHAALTDARGYLDLEAARAWPHLSYLQALTQTQGRGRDGHSWSTPASGALTVSFVLRPLVDPEYLAWLPLLAGLAVRQTVGELLLAAGAAWAAATKWPNDVLLLPTGATAVASVAGWGTSRKVAGILTELIMAPANRRRREPHLTRATAPAVIVGIGMNVAQAKAELPVPWAISLANANCMVTVAQTLEVLRQRLGELVVVWEQCGGNPYARLGGKSGSKANPFVDCGATNSLRLIDLLRAACWTLGKEVEISTVQTVLQAQAIDINPALVLRSKTGEVSTLAAGDVQQVRVVNNFD